MLMDALALSRLKTRISVTQVFLVYLNAGGDRFKTAAVNGLTVEEVTALAQDEKWDDKLADRRRLAEPVDGKTAPRTPEEVSQECCRLEVQALSTRLFNEIKTVLDHLERMPDADKLQYLFEVAKDGKRSPTAKFYLDMAKALDTAAQIRYRSLGDQLPARPDAGGGSDLTKLGQGLAAGMADAFKHLHKDKSEPRPVPVKVLP